MNSFIEKYPQNKKSTVVVRPYFDPRVDNMGLQNYGLSLFDGAFHEEQIVCLETNGIRRYLTGLNEFASELRSLSEEDREAKVKQIRSVVAQLEKELASNVITDLEDKNFWNNVKLLKPDNSEFWDKIKMRCGNEPVALTPDSDPYDLIKLYAIEAGGFSLISRSLEEARRQPVPPKFYLDKLEETASTNTEVKKLRNKAAALLQTLYDTNTNKLMYIAKALDPNSTQYKKSTPNDIVYENLDSFISGDSIEKDKRKSAKRFLDAAELDMETLKLKALVKDATAYKFIATKPDGFIYHLESSVMMGRTPADVVEFLKNPLNEQILDTLMAKVEKYWNN